MQCGHKDRRAGLGGEPTISVGSGVFLFWKPGSSMILLCLKIPCAVHMCVAHTCLCGCFFSGRSELVLLLG